MWLNDFPSLIELAVSLVPPQLINGCVADFVPSNGEWNLAIFAICILLRIAASRPPALTNDEDQRYWAFSKDGSFSTKSAYLLVNDNGYNKTDSPWQAIWKWKGPQSIKTFLWLLVHDKLKTRE